MKKCLGIIDFLLRGALVLAAIILMVGTVIFILRGNFNFLFTFYLTSAILFLGIFVLSRAPRNPVNFSFFAITVFIVIWSFSIFRYWISLSSQEALFWALIANAFGAFIPAFFIQFASIFPRKEKPSTIRHKFMWFGPAFFFMAAVFARLVIKDVSIVPDGYSVVPGSLFIFYMFYFLLYLGAGFVLLIKKYHIYTGSIKMQIRYVFLGSFLASVFPLITNLIFPLFGNSSLTKFGPYFTVIFVAFTAYAIVRHRLMSIEVVIQRGAVYGIATVLIMALYALAVIISETFFRRIMGYTSLLITAAAALLIAVAYQPLVREFQSLTDRLFFRGRYDYQKTLREISHKIASVIKLEELSKLIVSSFIDTMKVSEISFLLLEKEKEHFRSVSLSFPRYKKIEIDVGSPIISWLSAAKDILIRDEIEDEISRQEALGKEGEVQHRSLMEVRDEMERLGISTWVPIVSKDELIGIIALGNKLSGDVFTTEDIRLLSTLASQTALALDNARLYNEVVNMKDYSEEILQSMVSGVLTVDTRGRIVTYNNTAEKITGRKVPEALGHSCEELWGKRGEISKVIENTLKDRCYVNFESSIASPERGLVPVSFSSTILRDHQGKKIGTLLTIQDLSEVKELEGKVRRADKLSALATMAAGMAHEIKNPLSSMKVLSQLLPKKFDDAAFRKKLQEIIPREINRIDRIVESLLGFARAAVPNFEKHNIHGILDENLKYFKDQAEASEVKIITSFSDLPEIEVDREQISQVFSNLILNAIQVMPNGGELKVVTLSGKKIDDMLQNIKIQISDTGHGIPEETVKKLFDPFFTTKYGGTGLGLTITHSIVDGHKGYIDVESKLGKGTTFTVTLPVSQGLL